MTLTNDSACELCLRSEVACERTGKDDIKTWSEGTLKAIRVSQKTKVVD